MPSRRKPKQVTGSVPEFRTPRITIHKVYTRGGDTGLTSLVGGARVSKGDERLNAYGTVDELGAWIGTARVQLLEAIVSLAGEDRARLLQLDTSLERVQHELFNLGSELATPAGKLRPEQPQILGAHVDLLEEEMDSWIDRLAPLQSFVLPGGNALNVSLHVGRTVCRRAERIVVRLAKSEKLRPEVVRYLNRLSDALFVWSRAASHALGTAEVLWDPTAGGLPTTHRGKRVGMSERRQKADTAKIP